MTRVIEPEAKPNADYTTQQAADLCGISINTLLAWERRYGVPSPRRDERNERLYDASDLSTIRWLQAQTAQGIPIGKAIRLLPEMNPGLQPVESSNEDVIVALDATRMPPAAAIPAGTNGTAGSQRYDWQHELAVALQRYDRAAVGTILSTAALDTSPLVAAGGVILPLMEELVRRYEAGDLDRVVLKTAERWLSPRIAHWLDNAVPDRERAQAIALLVANDTPWSTVQALTIALRLAHEGYHIIDLPPGSPVEEIRSVVATTDASQVIFVVTGEGDHRAMDAHIDLLREVLPRSVTIARMDAHPMSNLQHATRQAEEDVSDPLHATPMTPIQDAQETPS